MNNFATGFLTGFMKDQADKISTRKDEAHDYFTKRLELAQDVAMKSRNKYEGKMDAAVQTSKQLMALGVPERVVMAAASQNPEDLNEQLKIVQELQTQGVDTSDPGFWEDTLHVSKEFNPDAGENITSVLKKVYQPLANNIKADPQSYDFDRKGTIWATMMGYNAMDSAMRQLETTPVIGNASAAQVLRDWGGEEDQPLNHPYDATVVPDYNKIGSELRDAKTRNETDGALTISQRGTILTQFDAEVKDILNTGIGGNSIEGSPEERLAIARKAAAPKILSIYPEAAGVSEITRYLDVGDNTGGASQSPSAAPVAPVPSQATPTPTEDLQGSQTPPRVITKLQDLGDGTSIWMKPDGTKVRYRNDQVEALQSKVAPPNDGFDPADYQDMRNMQ